MLISREVKEGKQLQGSDESISYTITTTPWGSSPTSISCAVFSCSEDGTTFTDVTATNMPTNTPTANGDIITLSPLKLLVAGTTYRVEVKFTVSGNIEEPYFYVLGER